MARSENQKSVLLLDDEPLILRFLNSCLQAEGYTQVTQARCGLDARAALEEKRFSIFITDVYLADVDGRELAQQFLKQNPDGQVLLMTGFASEELDLPEELQGRVQVLEKPFASERLFELLARPDGVTAPESDFCLEPISAPQTRLAAAVC